MSSRLIEIFKDERLIEKIRKRLPYLFHLAELESWRAGQIGKGGSGCIMQGRSPYRMSTKNGIDSANFFYP